MSGPVLRLTSPGRRPRRCYTLIWAGKRGGVLQVGLLDLDNAVPHPP